MSTYDPTDLRGQERDKAEEQAQKRIIRASEDDDFKWLMSSKRGRRIVWGLLADAGVFRGSFNQNSMAMAFNEGRRNYGLMMLNRVHALCAELYPVMQKENTNVRNDDGNADHSN